MKWVVRIGIIVIGIPSLAIGLLVAARFRPEHGHVFAETEINRPAAQVFPWITRPDLLQKWVGSLTEMTLDSPAANGGEVGKRYRMAQFDNVDNQTMEMELTVTEYVPNERFGIQSDSLGDPVNGFTETAVYRLTADGTHTHLSFDIHTTYRGKLPRVLEPLVTPAARKKVQQDLARLKTLVEAEPAIPEAEAAPPLAPSATH
jgi:uncharacterized protein YndB with AHSA1/START domain